MGERKVVSKYIPPDFDPSLVPRGKKLSSKDGTVPVRMMLPFSIQCSTCHTFLYRGRKFNSKKEPMGGPDGVYLGITRWRFYIKCTHCSRPLTFLTDPKNADYEMESGGTRNYEYTRDKNLHDEDAVVQEEKAAKEDPLKALETRVLDSQREMADLENLEEIRVMNARHLQLLKQAAGDQAFDADTQAVLARVHQARPENECDKITLTEQDEEIVKSIHFGKPSKRIHRLEEHDEQEEEERRKRQAEAILQRQRLLEAKLKQHKQRTGAIVVTKRKAPIEIGISETKELTVAPATAPSASLASLLGNYGSDSDSS